MHESQIFFYHISTIFSVLPNVNRSDKDLNISNTLIFLGKRIIKVFIPILKKAKVYL
jgi:hypothetical protein